MSYLDAAILFQVPSLVSQGLLGGLDQTFEEGIDTATDTAYFFYDEL